MLNKSRARRRRRGRGTVPPEVICAYPISPQTHIVRARQARRRGQAHACEFINVESEFAAMSVAIAPRGRPAPTPRREPGLLFIAEARVQRAVSACHRHDGRQPCHRRADQHLERPHHALSQRDCGYPAVRRGQPGGSDCTSRPSARRGTVRAVMVCMDGFILTHATTRGHATQEQVDAYLRLRAARCSTREPVSIGAMVAPSFMEVRFLAHAKQRQALELIPPGQRVQAHLRAASGASPTPTPRRCRDGVVLGSYSAPSRTPWTRCASRREDRVLASAASAVPTRRCARRSPREALLVLEKSLAVGLGGIVSNNVSASYHARPTTCTR